MPQTANNEMRVFVPITKVDVEKRLVYGTLAAEVPDKAGEIMDYETTKGKIQKWSDAQSEASGGKSLGNIREMHTNIAAGKLTDIVFDDDNKRVEGVSKVVDDSTWNKIVEGVLTGFSIGGGYAKRWIDPENPQLKRYTAEVSEFSYVDNPCQPGATFEVVKADGTVELRKFQTSPSSAQEAQPNMTTTSASTPENMTVPAPQQGWQASDGSFHAKKQDALAKNAELLINAVKDPAEKALAKLDETTTSAPEGEPAPAAAETNATTEGNEGDAPQAGAASDPASEGSGEPAAAPAAETAPEGDAGAAPAEKAAPTGVLKKGLSEVSRAADLLQSLCWLQSSVDWEAMAEKDGSPLPEALKNAVKVLGDWLKAYVVEEVDELFPMEEVEVLELAAKGAPVGALAKFVKDDAELSKAAGADVFVERLEKAMNKTAGAHLAAMFDHHSTMQKCMDGMAKCMKALGMGDDEEDGEMEKLAKSSDLTDEQLTKLAAFDGLKKSFDDLTGKLAAVTERLEKVESTPAATKGIVNTALVTKGHEAGAGAQPDEVTATLNKMIAGAFSPEQTALALTKAALRNPVTISSNQ